MIVYSESFENNQDRMKSIIAYLNNKYKVFTTSNVDDEHILYNHSGIEYSPGASTTLPYTNNKILHIDSNSEPSIQQIFL